MILTSEGGREASFSVVTQTGIESPYVSHVGAFMVQV